jgi:endonuclease-3
VVQSLTKISKGIYLLVIKLEKNLNLSAGNLPMREYRKGIYFYIGSARKGLMARIKRHLRDEKKVFWHIDYLLKEAKVKEIWVKENNFHECQSVKKVTRILKEANHYHEGFGSSDCKCSSHLIYAPQGSIQLKELRKKIGFERISINRIQSQPLEIIQSPLKKR